MARRRSIYDTGNYSTPLADFLEEIPNYFLKFEQLKQAEADRADQKAFRNQQYSDQIAQQTKNNIYRQEQADNQERNRLFGNHTKLMQGMSSLQQTQYIDNVIKKDPNLKGYMDFSEFESFSKKIQDANTEYDDINADVDDFRGSSSMSMFPRYQDVAKTYQELQNMEKSVRGTDLELGHAKDLKYVADLKKQLETLSGREMAEKDMPETMQRQFSSIVKSNDADYKSLSEAADELSIYADFNPKTKKWDKRTVSLEEFAGGQSSLDRGYNSAIRAFKNAESRYMESSATRNTFTKQQGLFYPKITTAKQEEELDAQSEARTSWFNENESYINSNPETAKLLVDYLTDPTNADRFSALQKAVVDNKGYDEFEAQTDAEIAALDDEIEPYVEGAKEPATEFEPGADITGEDVDDVLADVRETTGFFPEGDAPREPATKRDTDIDLPSIVEPLTARSDKETEATIKEREKEAGESELFPEPLKSTNVKYIISDISKSGKETGKVRRYVDYSLGNNLKQLKDLRKRVPNLEGRGDKYNLKQINEKISSLENKIRESIGDYVNPETGEFSNPEYTKRIYQSLKRTLPDLQMRELMDLLRDFSTAQGTSKALTLQPVSTSKDGTVYSAIK
jgi:hypothetical protein